MQDGISVKRESSGKDIFLFIIQDYIVELLSSLYYRILLDIVP